MLLRTRCYVVLGLIVCLRTLPAAQAPATDPVLFDPGPFYDAADRGCSVIDRPGDPVTIVGLTDAVDPSHAPIPGNDSERLLFRQVYDTLVRIGCDHSVQPGLAAAWQLDSTGTAWNLTLRSDARFSDGTTVTAHHVIAGWTRGTSALLPDVSRYVQTATALDDRTLSIVLHDQRRPGLGSSLSPGLLANPALAVARSSSESSWPLGTRDVRVESVTIAQPRGATMLTVVSTSVMATAPASSAPNLGSDGTRVEAGVVRFLVIRSRDVRDILDQGIDLLVTRDPAALAYASALAQFDSIPLPWSRSYVFVSRGSGPASALPLTLRQRLADDAVPGEARGSSYGWPQAWESCALDSRSAIASDQPQSQGAVRSGRIVYDQADAVARALAERIVALTSARSAESQQILDVLIPKPRSQKLQMVSLPGAVFPSALTRGDDAGYVLALDRANGCDELRLLLQQAPWLTREHPVPLVDTRPRALLRKGRSHVTMDWDGGLLLGGPPQAR